MTLTRIINIPNQNMEAWEEAKKEISLIPDHPNRLPEGAEDGPVGSKPGATARRLSSARGL